MDKVSERGYDHLTQNLDYYEEQLIETINDKLNSSPVTVVKLFGINGFEGIEVDFLDENALLCLYNPIFQVKFYGLESTTGHPAVINCIEYIEVLIDPEFTNEYKNWNVDFEKFECVTIKRGKVVIDDAGSKTNIDDFLAELRIEILSRGVGSSIINGEWYEYQSLQDTE